MKIPSISYGAVLLLGVSSALCGGWASQILLYGTKLDTLKPLLVAFVLVGILIAFAPLLPFMPRLYAARRQGRAEYGALVSDYARDLEKRWIRGRARADLLGSPDFSGLADLETTYRDNVERMQVFLLGLRTPQSCWWSRCCPRSPSSSCSCRCATSSGASCICSRVECPADVAARPVQAESACR